MGDACYVVGGDDVLGLDVDARGAMTLNEFLVVESSAAVLPSADPTRSCGLAYRSMIGTPRLVAQRQQYGIARAKDNSIQSELLCKRFDSDRSVSARGGAGSATADRAGGRMKARAKMTDGFRSYGPCVRRPWL